MPLTAEEQAHNAISELRANVTTLAETLGALRTDFSERFAPPKKVGKVKQLLQSVSGDEQLELEVSSYDEIRSIGEPVATHLKQAFVSYNQAHLAYLENLKKNDGQSIKARLQLRQDFHQALGDYGRAVDAYISFAQNALTQLTARLKKIPSLWTKKDTKRREVRDIARGLLSDINHAERCFLNQLAQVRQFIEVTNEPESRARVELLSGDLKRICSNLESAYENAYKDKYAKGDITGIKLKIKLKFRNSNRLELIRFIKQVSDHGICTDMIRFHALRLVQDYISEEFFAAGSLLNKSLVDVINKASPEALPEAEASETELQSFIQESGIEMPSYLGAFFNTHEENYRLAALNPVESHSFD